MTIQQTIRTNFLSPFKVHPQVMNGISAEDQRDLQMSVSAVMSTLILVIAEQVVHDENAPWIEGSQMNGASIWEIARPIVVRVVIIKTEACMGLSMLMGPYINWIPSVRGGSVLIYRLFLITHLSLLSHTTEQYMGETSAFCNWNSHKWQTGFFSGTKDRQQG